MKQMILAEIISESRISKMDETIAKAQEKISAMNHLKAVTRHACNVLDNETELHKAIKKAGLEITDLKVIPYGAEALNPDTHDNKVKFEAHLSPRENSRFRFIAFKGYDSKGAGKNRKQLESKAQKLSEKFSTDNFSASINPFSVEDNNTSWGSSRNSPNRLLISWRPKF